MILIDLEGKSDREILISLVQMVNGITERFDKLNGKCTIHDDRIRIVENWHGGTHDDRLRILENWQNKLLGMGLAAIVVIPVLTALAVKVFVP